MKVDFLVNQAKKYVPLLCNNFSETNKIKKVVVENGLFTVETEENLNIDKNSDAIFYITGIPLQIDIESIQKISKTEAIMITKQNHDQTKNPNKPYQKKVYIKIQGCSDELYNEETEVLEDYQDGGYKLRIKVNSNTTDNPDTSNAFFYINSCYKGNGIKKVKILSKNTFSFQEEDTKLNFTVENIDNMFISKNIRIYPAYDLDDAKALFSRNLGFLLKDEEEKKEKTKLSMKKSDQCTAYIVLEHQTKNTAENNTSVGYYEYNFSVYVFCMHRNIEKYKIRNLQDKLQHEVFGKIFGLKGITLSDNVLSVNKTENIYFFESNIIERLNDYSIFQLKYKFNIRTFDEDYTLPVCDVRLNNINMEITNRDGNRFFNVDMLL